MDNIFIYLIIYFIIGIVTSFYMIDFYVNLLKRPIKKQFVYLAVIGPFIWPLQIIKHIYDIVKLLRNDKK